MKLYNAGDESSTTLLYIYKDIFVWLNWLIKGQQQRSWLIKWD